MGGSLTTGLILVLLGGFFQGTFMLPSKGMKGWAWENYWLIFAVTAYLICPWALAAATVNNLFAIYAGVSAFSILAAGAYGFGWGLGALTFGLGVEAVGIGLGFAVILGVAAASGTLIPLVVLASESYTFEQGLVTGVAVALVLAGVATCSFAGRWKEKNAPTGASYRKGVGICVVSGLLSACGNLGFAFGTEIIEYAQKFGNAEHIASNALWTLLTFPLFLCNAGYSGRLLRRNRSIELYQSVGSPRRIVLAISMGIMWMGGIGFYGMGARRLGELGPSLGWAILMSTMVLVANAWGLLTGEWREAPGPARRQLAAGLALLIVAIWLLAYANQL